MPAPYDAATIANQFIALASKEQKKLTPMQLIKLSYIAHGFSLAIFRRPLLDEAIEAWRYGPVIPSLYDKLKRYGSRPVDGAISTPFFGAEVLEDDDLGLLDQVFNKYGGLNGLQLSHLTHKPGTPWAQNYKPDEYGIEIDDQQIKSHYAEMLKK
jgi:uncharacterized phage-associated protein